MSALWSPTDRIRKFSWKILLTEVCDTVVLIVWTGKTCSRWENIPVSPTERHSVDATTLVAPSLLYEYIYLGFGDRVSHHQGWPWTHHMAMSGLEFLILPPLIPKGTYCPVWLPSQSRKVFKVISPLNLISRVVGLCLDYTTHVSCELQTSPLLWSIPCNSVSLAFLFLQRE